MILNDLERRNSPYFAFFHQILQILGRFHSGWKEQTYNVRKILSSSSGNLDFVDISSRPELRCSSKNDDLRLVCVESLRRNRHRTAFMSSWRAFWEPVQHQWRSWQRAAACPQRTDDMRRHETRWALRPASRTLWRAVVRALTLGNTRCAPTHGKEIIRPNRRKCIRSRFCTLQI